MAIKQILFNTEMVRAILDGRKTVTRRVIPGKLLDEYYDYDEYCNNVIPNDVPCTRFYERDFFANLSRYQPGDILYVRETWAEVETVEGRPYYIYRVDDDSEYYSHLYSSRPNFTKWQSSTHMPKEAARIFLRVTNVRVERLQECSKGWCLEIEREGVVASQSPILYINDDMYHDALRKEFKKLWDSSIKKSDLTHYGWDSNPWVWVIEFERCEKPKEAIQIRLRNFSR